MTAPILEGGSYTRGSILAVIQSGENFINYLPHGVTSTTGSITSEEVSPVCAFDDFALFEAADLDPAMTYAGWNTAGMLTGKTGYTRPWGIFYPPLDYGTSDGLLWPRAAYMAAGFQVNALPQNISQNLNGVQVEVMPLAGTGLDQIPAPSGYDPPRAAHIVVKPTRLNFAVNPNFAVSSAGWVSYGSSALSDTGEAVFSDTTGMLAVIIPGLIFGDTYTVSLLSQLSGGIADVQLAVGSQTGGIIEATTNDLGPAQVQPSLTFTAPASTVTLFVTPVPATTFNPGEVDAGTEQYDDGEYGSGPYGGIPGFPYTIQLSEILIEAGSVVGTYFDGSFGDPDYQWTGDPGLSQSFWYENYKPGAVVINDIITRQIPLSVSAADPEYLQPPTQ